MRAIPQERRVVRMRMAKGAHGTGRSPSWTAQAVQRNRDALHLSHGYSINEYQAKLLGLLNQ